eukprot:gene20999-27212_t
MSREFYKILQVSHNATLAEIKKSYRQLALKYHPDITGGDKTLSEKFKLITNAYEILSDEKKRSDYDRSMGYSRFTSDSHTYHKNYSNVKPTSYSYKKTYSKSSYSPPIYGFNEKEWYEGHYGVHRQSKDSFYREGDKAQEYYRNYNKKYEEKMQAKMKSENQIREEAIENLKKNREMRRKEDNKSYSSKNNDSSCSIL